MVDASAARDDGPAADARIAAPVTFLPGINNTPDTYGPVCSHLTESGYSATAVDLPARDEIETLAAEVLNTLPERAVVAGHSFGGYVAIEMLRQSPERLAGLVLINSFDRADTAEAAERRKRAADIAEDGGYQQLAEQAAQRTYHPGSLHREDLMSRRAAAIENYGSRRYIAHQAAAAGRADGREILAHTAIPVMVIAATDDLVISPSRQESMATEIQASFRTIARSGHMLPAERPDALAHTIAEWLPAATGETNTAKERTWQT